jgi:hypothetical protein
MNNERFTQIKNSIIVLIGESEYLAFIEHLSILSIEQAGTKALQDDWRKLSLSVRTSNCIAEGIKTKLFGYLEESNTVRPALKVTIKELISLPDKVFFSIPKMGRKSVIELRRELDLYVKTKELLFQAERKRSVFTRSMVRYIQLNHPYIKSPESVCFEYTERTDFDT